jgi:hypothetical protein
MTLQLIVNFSNHEMAGSALTTASQIAPCLSARLVESGQNNPYPAQLFNPIRKPVTRRTNKHHVFGDIEPVGKLLNQRRVKGPLDRQKVNAKLRV